MKSSAYKKQILYGCFFIFLFLCFYLFFTMAHPLYIYDTDDWTYISNARHAWPMPDAWNPTKIFPETLMPLVAELGLIFIMPFTGDYIGSLSYAFAFALSLAIVFYLFNFGKLFINHYHLNFNITVLLLTILALFHFLPFQTAVTENKHMFYGSSVNMIFNYVLPELINATVTIYLITHPIKDWSKNSLIKNGFLILLLYLCINSNMFHSIILISYIGSTLLFSFVKSVTGQEKLSLTNFLHFIQIYLYKNYLEFLLVLCWLISIILESQGGRAQWNVTSGEFLPFIQETGHYFIQSITGIRTDFLLILLLIIITAIIIYIVSKIKEGKLAEDSLEDVRLNKISDIDKTFIQNISKEIICLFITLIYLLMLCSKVSPTYVANSWVMISWIFWVILIAFSSFAYIAVKMPKTVLVFPLILYILFFEVIIDAKTYANSSGTNFTPETVKALDENLIRQVTEADLIGLEAVEVLIPIHGSPDWPMAVSYGGERIAQTLFHHGITSKVMNITLVPDISINNEFHLP